MYGVKNNYDLSFLKDKRLIQICIGKNQLIFKLEENISISVESIISVIDVDSKIHKYTDITLINKKLLELIEHSIIYVNSSEAGTLTLQFDNGSKLEFIDDSKNYESYQIMINGKTFVV